MRKVRIYIDVNYPKRLVDALHKIHELQTEKQYELIRHSSYEPNSSELEDSIFLLVDFNPKTVDVTTRKQYEEGCRVIACKAGGVEKIDFFEFSMTVLRVWPQIVEKAKEDYKPCLYTFRYAGRKLSKMKS